MRTLSTFLVIALFSYQFSLAQTEIVVVDMEVSVDNWLEVLNWENVFDENHDSLLTLGELWASKWQQKYKDIILMLNNRCDPFPEGEFEKIEQELKAEQQAILEYEKFITDTIPAYQERIIATIRARVLGEIASLSKTNQYKFVFQKTQILYQETGYPVTQIEIPYTKSDAQYLATTIDELKQKLAFTCTNYRQKLERDYP